MKKKKEYYYTPCECNEKGTKTSYKQYFRLYTIIGGVHTLVDQGLAPMIDGWEDKYGAVFNQNNPYPHLD